MANPFDQLEDAPAVEANPFDQLEATQPDTGMRRDDIDAFLEAQATPHLRDTREDQLAAYNPSFRDRTREFVRPLSELLSKLSTAPEGMPQIPHLPDASTLKPVDVWGTQVSPSPVVGAVANTAIDLISDGTNWNVT